MYSRKYNILDKNIADNFEDMRYSMLQEQEYGVALPQNQLPNEINESVTIDTDTIEPENNNPIEEGSMVSNLPLLFANGHPTSLEKITLV